MACNLTPSIGTGAHDNPTYSNISADTKVKIEEPSPSDAYDLQLERMKVDSTLCDTACEQDTSDRKRECYNLKDVVKVETEENIKAVEVKVEDCNNGFSECELKYTKEKKYVTWDEGTNTSCNLGKHFTEGDSVMACHYIKPPINTMVDSHPKVEIGEHGVLNRVKTEPSMSDDCDVQDLQPDVMNIDYFYNIVGDSSALMPDRQLESYSLKDVIKTDIEEPIKAKPTEYASVMQTTQDGDEFSELKYIKEEQCVAWEEGTNSSVEKYYIEGDCAGPSSSTELKSEEVDLNELKMDKDEVTGSESFQPEDSEIGPRYSTSKEIQHSTIGGIVNSVTHKVNRCKHCKYTTTFDCTKCGKEFSSKHALNGHIVAMHSDQAEMMKSVNCRIYRCTLCRYITTYARNWAHHMGTHGEKHETVFYCIKCERKFSTKQTLDGHIVALHSNNNEMMKSVTHKIYRCRRCRYITAVAKRLTQHIMTTHGEKPETTFDCIKCGKGFSSKCSLGGHIVAMHGDDDEMMKNVTCKIYRCKYCRYITVNMTSMTQHMRTHGEKLETFDCKKCEKEFSSKRSLFGHIVALHNNNDEMMKSVTSKIYRCKECRYITVMAFKFTKHMRVHEKKIGKHYSNNS